jgi:hypothetical protein
MALTNSSGQVLAYLLFAASLLLPAGCDERFESKYESYAHAEQAGGVRRGWVPEFIPRGSTEILEYHDLDTNEGWLRIAAPAAGSANMLSGGERVWGHQALRSPGLPWWPTGLQGTAPPREWQVYRLKSANGSVIYAFTTAASDDVWLWRPS